MDKLEIQSDVKPFTIIKNEIIDSESVLNEHEKLLYIVLLRYGNKAFPSLNTLSKKCGISKKTVQRTINTLIEKGILTKKNRTNKRSGNTSNIYTLIDNESIWHATKENIKENINAAILEDAIRIVKASGMTVSEKEKGLVSDGTQTIDTSTKKNYAVYNKQNTTIETKSQAELHNG